MASMLCVGTLMLTVMKMQDDVVVGKDKDGKPLSFNHPYLQCCLMFLGEFLCLIVFALKSACTKNGGFSKQISEINPVWMALPCSFDLFGSSLLLLAMTMCAASVYQMVRGSMVIITAVYALIFLGSKQYSHHWFSLFLILTGTVIVGAVSVINKEEGSDLSTTSTLGLMILVGSLSITGAQMVIEQKILGDRNLDPLFVVGFEGFWGLCLMSVLLPTFQQIPCEKDFCNNGRVENVLVAIEEYKQNPILIAQSIVFVLCITGYNFCGVSITNYASAAQRTSVDTTSTLSVWVVMLALGKEKFLWGQLFGFAVLLCGTLIYNEIIEIPIGYFRYNTKQNMAVREKAGKSDVHKAASK
jgi:drug/metabolite transporter (DMT)-like permease